MLLGQAWFCCSKMCMVTCVHNYQETDEKKKSWRLWGQTSKYAPISLKSCLSVFRQGNGKIWFLIALRPTLSAFKNHSRSTLPKEINRNRKRSQELNWDPPWASPPSPHGGLQVLYKEWCCGAQLSTWDTAPPATAFSTGIQGLQSLEKQERNINPSLAVQVNFVYVIANKQITPPKPNKNQQSKIPCYLHILNKQHKPENMKMVETSPPKPVNSHVLGQCCKGLDTRGLLVRWDEAVQLLICSTAT